MTPKIMHLVPLDTVGGVEQLYSFYIGATRDRFSHITLNDRKNVAPMLQSNIEQASLAILSTKYSGKLKLPRKPDFIRRSHLKRLIRHYSPDLLVVWNKVEGFDLSLSSPGTKVIYYEHGAGWYSPAPQQAKSFLGQVDSIICNSHAAAEVIKSKWDIPSGTPIQVCHNCIRKDCLPEQPVPAKQLGSAPYTLGMAGRLLSRKGIPLALHSLKKLLDNGGTFRLKIAGTGPEEEHFRQLASSLGIEAQVDFLGLVSNMASFYQEIDAFLCPSVTEPFGLVAAEAGAYGVPVIASAVDGLAEVIKSGQTGLLVPPTLSLKEYETLGGKPEQLLDRVYLPTHQQVAAPRVVSPEALAEAVASLFNDKSRYDDISYQCQVHVREQFHPEKYVLSLNDIFTQLLN